jgi:hypothetical protein
MEVEKYMESAREWKEHTASDEFADAFIQVMKDNAHDNELRSAKVEEFLISQALKIGVVKQKKTRIAANPNRWAKHLAPWYNDRCREAKRKYKQCK